MTISNFPMYPQVIGNGVAQIVNATGTGSLTLYTAGGNGSVINHILATSTDTSDRVIQISININGTNYLLTSLTIPANSGNTAAVPPVSVLRNAQFPGLTIDSNGNPLLYISNTGNPAVADYLTIACTTTVTSGKAVNFVVQAGDF